MFDEEARKPKVFDARTVGLAVAAHLLLFAALFLVGQFAAKPKETVVPIDLTVVVHENPDGAENEPPPEKEVASPEPEPAPEPPPPPPEPAPALEPAPAPQVDAVERTEEPKKEPPKKVEPPPRPRPKPKPRPEQPPKPLKSKEQIAQERAQARARRLREIRNAVKRGEAPRTDGRTEKRPPDWRELLGQGYTPGAKTQIAADESQRCLSLIRRAFYAKWDSPPWTDALGDMILEVRFGPGGVVKSCRLVKSSGDRAADDTVLAAAAQVASVPGLTHDFLSQNPSVKVRFKVKPN